MWVSDPEFAFKKILFLIITSFSVFYLLLAKLMLMYSTILSFYYFYRLHRYNVYEAKSSVIKRKLSFMNSIQSIE